MTDPCESCDVPFDLVWTCDRCKSCKFCELSWFSEDVLEKEQVSFWEYELALVAKEREELLE